MPAKTPVPEFTSVSDKAYLLTYTLPTSKQLHYAYSLDGAKWTTINGNRPVLKGEYADVELKAPFIRRVNIDGKDVFHLVAGMADNSQPGFYHLVSEDLVNWQAGENENILVKPSSSDISKAESPEWIYVESSSTFFIYWSARSGDRNNIYLTTTKDWKKFISPRILYSTNYSVYDMHIEKTGDTYTGIFYNSDRNLCQTQTNVLRTSGTSFAEPQRIFSSQIPKSRAPQTFPALDDTGWFLLYNSTERARQAMSRTGNIAEKKWYPCDENDLSLPEGAEEGSVLVISASELKNLLDNFFYEECDVLPTAEKEARTWKYQTTVSGTSTGNAWTRPAYRDNGWTEGLSGFGVSSTPGSHVNTTWNSSVIRLRYHLDLTGFTPEQMNALTGRIHHDEDVTVYFNSVVAFQESGYLTNYKNISLNQEALDALTPDDTNVIAIECTNKGGGQYIDFGLTGIRPIATGIEKIHNSKLKTQNEGTIGHYNLSGQRLSRPIAGVNIVGGKKILY
jgi:beta-galactosidase